MTQRRALGDLDFDSAFDDPDNGWFGHVRAVDPTTSRDHADAADVPPHDDVEDFGAISTEDTDRWPVLIVDPAPPEVEDPPQDLALDWPPAGEPADHRSTDVETPRGGRDTIPETPVPSWESRLSSSGAWDFKVAASGPRRRSKFLVAAMIVASLALAGVVLLVGNPGAGPDQPRVVSPSTPTAQQPAPPSTAAPPSARSQAPLPPPGPTAPPPAPPPAPPTPVQEIRPPVVTREYTPRRQTAPSNTDKPEIGVTRVPTTRTQISASPPPPPPPDRNSATPGDGKRGRHGFGGFGF